MIITAYPNGELRARIAAPCPVSRCSGSGSAAPNILVNRSKLAILPPVEACRYPQSAWPRVGYGGQPPGTKFSPGARRTLARAGGVFAPASENRLIFLTGTLPGSSQAAIAAFAAHSSWTTHQLMTIIPRSLGALPSELRWMWVWEYQGRGALHWHCAIELPSIEMRDGFLADWHALWCSVVRGVSRRAGIDICARADGGTWRDAPEIWRTDAQIAYASPSQYLAKYLGKDAGKSPSAEADGNFHPPTRWYSCSRRILSELRELTLHIDSHEGQCGCPSWLISDADMIILRYLDGRCSAASVHPFVDKFRTGATVVFYPGEPLDNLIDAISAIIRNAQPSASDIPPHPPGKKTMKDDNRPVMPKFSYPYLLMLSGHPRARRGFLQSLSEPEYTDYFLWLELYNLSPTRMRALDNRAYHALYFSGVFADVKAPPCEGGLTCDAAKEPQDEGMRQVGIDYPA